MEPSVNGPEAELLPMTVLTMGCRVNQFESVVIEQGGKGRGFRLVDGSDPVDLVVINTCSVTGESDRQARQLIRRAVKDHPMARIVVTGCYAQHAPETLAALPGVDLVLGNGEKSRLWELLAEIPRLPQGTRPKDGNDRIRVEEVDQLTQVPDRCFVDHFGDRSRAFLHVQDGCDRACTYCLIPQVRGPSRSVPLAWVMEQGRRFVAAGYEELVLTGVDLGGYGRDLEDSPSLSGLVEKLLSLPDLGRLRISSLDPMDLDWELIGLFATTDRLCRHLHLSIQSGDDGVRKRMGRGGDRQKVMQRIAWLREACPEVILGADFIVGFPSETETAFAQTLAFIVEAELSLLHVFPYSSRPDTKAANMAKSLWVPKDRMRERALQLRQAGEVQWRRVAEKRLGCKERVLLESVVDGWGTGKTDGFFVSRFPLARAEWRGRLLPVTTVGFDPVAMTLIGQVVDDAPRDG